LFIPDGVLAAPDNWLSRELLDSDANCAVRISFAEHTLTSLEI
jgi:hypothetical protein